MRIRESRLSNERCGCERIRPGKLAATRSNFSRSLSASGRGRRRNRRAADIVVCLPGTSNGGN
jgi:hypothetical protein